MATKKAAAQKIEAPAKEETTKALAAVPQGGGLVAASAAEAAWGSEGIGGGDLLIPKLTIMQGLSKLVTAGEAMVGEIRDSLSGDHKGGKKGKEVTPVPMIAFQSFKTWVVFEKRNGKDEYVKTIPITAENEGLAINEVVGGVEVRRDKCLNFYVLLPSEIAEGMAFPYLVSFRRTSSQAGRKLATFSAKLRAFKRPMASKVFDLGVETLENDKGTFFGYTIAMGRDATPQELAEARKWYDTLKTATVKHDDSDLKDSAAARPTAQAPSDDSTDY